MHQKENRCRDFLMAGVSLVKRISARGVISAVGLGLTAYFAKDLGFMPTLVFAGSSLTLPQIIYRDHYQERKEREAKGIFLTTGQEVLRNMSTIFGVTLMMAGLFPAIVATQMDAKNAHQGVLALHEVTEKLANGQDTASVTKELNVWPLHGWGLWEKKTFQVSGQAKQEGSCLHVVYDGDFPGADNSPVDYAIVGGRLVPAKSGLATTRKPSLADCAAK